MLHFPFHLTLFARMYAMSLNTYSINPNQLSQSTQPIFPTEQGTRTERKVKMGVPVGFQTQQRKKKRLSLSLSCLVPVWLFFFCLSAISTKRWSGYTSEWVREWVGWMSEYLSALFFSLFRQLTAPVSQSVSSPSFSRTPLLKASFMLFMDMLLRHFISHMWLVAERTYWVAQSSTLFESIRYKNNNSDGQRW